MQPDSPISSTPPGAPAGENEPAGRPIPRDPEALLFPIEAAYLLAVGVRTLEQWRWRGCGPLFCSLGNSSRSAVRYRRADVLSFRDQRVRRSTSDPGVPRSERPENAA
jgi:hypothetical protein